MKKIFSLVLLFMILGTGCSYHAQTYHKFNVHYDMAWMPNPALIDSSTPTSLFLGSAEADIELTFPSTGGEAIDQIGAVRITNFVLDDPNCTLTVPNSLYTDEIRVELEESVFMLATKVLPKPKVSFGNLKWSDGADLPPLSVNMECPVVGSIPLTADIYPLVLGVFDDYDFSTTCMDFGMGDTCHIIKNSNFSAASSNTMTSIPFMDAYVATFSFTLEDLGETTLE